VISAVGVLEAEGRSARTDQVGLERRSAISRDLFFSSWEELYARVGMGCRFWANSACRRDARQRKYIDLDILKFKYHLEHMSKFQDTKTLISKKLTRELVHSTTNHWFE
jgi:hypothetical protein